MEVQTNQLKDNLVRGAIRKGGGIGSGRRGKKVCKKIKRMEGVGILSSTRSIFDAVMLEEEFSMEETKSGWAREIYEENERGCSLRSYLIHAVDNQLTVVLVEDWPSWVWILEGIGWESISILIQNESKFKEMWKIGLWFLC